MDPPTAYAVVLLLLACATLGTAYWVRRRDRGRAARAFTVLLVLGACWSIGLALQVVATSLGVKTAFFLSWASAAWLVAPTWAAFAVHYAGRDRWLSRSIWLAIGAFWAIVVALTLTNPLHGLLWTDFALGTEPFPHLVFERTPLYWAIQAIAYAFVLFGIGLLVRLVLTARRVSAAQSIAIVVGVLVPLALNVWHHASSRAIAELNLTAPGTVAFLVLVGWALFRHQLFGVEPIARTTALEAIDDGFLVVDAEGRLVDYNRRAIELFPAVGDAFGRRLGELVPPLAVADEVSRSSGRFGAAETIDVEREGRVRTLSVSRTPLSVGDDDRGTIFLLRDVTDLERKTEMLERFASTVSHDLRNPLTVADGYVELAVETGDVSHLEDAKIAHDRMAEIIDEVLELARTGIHVENTRPVSLAAVAADAWETTATPDLECDVRIDSDRRVVGDERRIRTIFENLFRNVVDHAPTATTVVVDRLEDGDGFYVEDDGDGIPESARDRLFDRGYTSSEEGTGIGLRTVAEIAAAHGWTVEADDGELGGARFTVSNAAFDSASEEEPSLA